MTVDFSRIDAELVQANKWIAAGNLVNAAFEEAADRDPSVAADIAAMNARPAASGNWRCRDCDTYNSPSEPACTVCGGHTRRR